MLTGKLVDVDDEARADLPGFLKRLAGRLGEPVIRRAVAAGDPHHGRAVRARPHHRGGARSAPRKDGCLCSFDMLGEGARTAADADRYETTYADAIEAVGKHAKGAGPRGRPRRLGQALGAVARATRRRTRPRVWDELYPRIQRLALIAAEHDINFTIDAEEADRLVLSLKLLDRLAREPELGDWTRPRPRRAGLSEARPRR